MKLLLLTFCAGLCAPAWAGATASAQLIDTAGRAAGEAHFRAAPHGVLIELRAQGLAPGPHAILIHASGACDPKSGFASAGPVFDFALPRPHGFFAKGGPKPGDLPMQFAGADGSLHASLYTSAFSLGDGKRSLFGKSGAALVIHAAGDDYASQPEGRSGMRVACGPILKGAASAHHRKKK